MNAALARQAAAFDDLLPATVVAAAVHVGAAWLAIATLAIPNRELVAPVEPQVIEASIIDQRELDAEVQRLRDAEAAERRAAEQASAAAEAKRIEMAREVAEKEAADRRTREEIAAKKKAEQERLAREAAKTKKEAAAQAQREKELQAQVAAEERRRKAERSGAMTKYVSAVQQKVIRNWLQPAGLAAGLDCVVRVEQLPTGDVVRATVTTCNGDAQARRSIEDAVLKASPLPTPTDRTLYSRVLEFNFRPTERTK